MPAFGRGTLAAALATAMAVAPALAQETGLAGKPVPKTTVTQPEREPILIDRVAEYSETHPVIVIGIAKGRKDEMSGERIGEILSDALKKVHDAPSEVFIEQGGDYTAVIFAVDGLIYGAYGLTDSLIGMSLAANSYNEVVRPKATHSSGDPTLAGKPAPQR